MLLLAGTDTGGVEGSGGSVGRSLRQMFISGAAITIPLFVTIIVLVFVVNFLLGAIDPLVVIVNDAFWTSGEVPGYAPELIAIATLFGIILAVGFVAEKRPGSGLERAFDTAMARIPAVGSVYTSFNEMSELLLSNDTQSFQEVKLVEFPTEGMYSVAFVTAETPPEIERATDSDDMLTLFMPMAPNPVMGGYVIHVPRDRVYDVDISVEEGVRSIVTSGVAVGRSDDDYQSEKHLIDVGEIRRQARERMDGFDEWRRQSDRIDASAVLQADDLDELKEQTRRELYRVHPDRDEADLDESDSPTHYTLADEASEPGEGNSGGEQS